MLMLLMQQKISYLSQQVPKIQLKLSYLDYFYPISFYSFIVIRSNDFRIHIRRYVDVVCCAKRKIFPINVSMFDVQGVLHAISFLHGVSCIFVCVSISGMHTCWNIRFNIRISSQVNDFRKNNLIVLCDLCQFFSFLFFFNIF